LEGIKFDFRQNTVSYNVVNFKFDDSVPQLKKCVVALEVASNA